MSSEGRARLWAREKTEPPITFKPPAKPSTACPNPYTCKRCNKNLVKVKHARLGEKLCVVCKRIEFPSYQSRTQHIIQREFNAIVGDRAPQFPDRKVIFDSGWYEHRKGDPLPPIESFRIPSENCVAK